MIIFLELKRFISEENMKNFLFILLLSFICVEGALSIKAKDISLANLKRNFQAKTYQQMNDAEKNRFITDESNKILEKFGRADGDKISEKGLKLIRQFVDSYAARLGVSKTTDCAFGNDLATLLTRGSQYAKTIGDEFTKINLPAQSGIYTAMIESEFCPCLQSPTGSLGIFQFTAATGKIYGLKTVAGSTPQNPDERCNPQLSARASAKYLQKMLAIDFGNQTNSVGYPLAIASFNRGEGATKKHIKAVTELNGTKNVGFWTFLDTSDEIAAKPDQNYMKQFQMENFKYVPKFFAAAIVGENPQTFGVNLAPLSESK